MSTGGHTFLPGDPETGPDRRADVADMAENLLPEGGNLNVCTGCGICAAGCPASGLAGMDPRTFVRLLALKMDEKIMSGGWVWMCTLCNRCLHACPMDVNIPELVLLVRRYWPKERLPSGIKTLCRKSLGTDTRSALGLDAEDWRFILEETADSIRENQHGFETLDVPLDKKGAQLFLNQNSRLPVETPYEMAPLWKLLHLAGADWTYGTTGWASENYCMFLSRTRAWEQLVRDKARAVNALGCRELVNTECGHDFFALKEGLVRFGIEHAFEIKSIIEYYARWIRTGRLKVNAAWNRDLKIKFTVQDPCQLVRKGYGDFIADELRFVVKAAVGEEHFIDMYPARSNNYCCGGGGGAIATDYAAERRLYGNIKVQQILETGAAYCITPCNNCHRQINDLGAFNQQKFRAVHLWTILCLAMGVLGETERNGLGPDLKGVNLRNEVVL